MTEMSSVNDVVVSVAAATDRGMRRDINEDSYLAQSPLFLVADGMGGYDAGDEASAAVVAAFRDNIRGTGYTTFSEVQAALIAANRGVSRVASQTRRGAGSTVTGVALVEHEGQPHWLIFNVGDSRVYQHTGSELVQLTVDHSLGQELVDRGALSQADLPTFAKRNVITRAIGADDSSADSWLMPVTNGERILICSDGLTSEVSDESIRATLTMSGMAESAASALVSRANHAGGRDNITVIVLDVLAGGVPDNVEYTTGARAVYGEAHDSVLDDTTIPV